MLSSEEVLLFYDVYLFMVMLSSIEVLLFYEVYLGMLFILVEKGMDI